MFCDFSAKVTCAFLAYKKQWRYNQNLTLFESKKRCHLPHYIFDQIKVSRLPNRALPSLHGGSI